MSERADIMTGTQTRKLTTILCADVCGYSRLMGKDEEGTLERLKIARKSFSKLIEDHEGRVINMAGDAIIADFSSVVQAVQCAINVQTFFKSENEKSNQPDPLIFRIGLNLGDVLIEGSDIFGDGVNVAARLESLAPAGGVSISGTVYDHVKNRFSGQFTFTGNQTVKNISDPVPVYSLSLLDESISPAQNSKAEDPGPQKEEMDAETKEIYKEVRRKAAFYRRAVATGGLIFFLFLINIITSASYLWFIWPAMPLTFILAMDAMRVFGKGHFDKEWEERQIEAHKKRRKKS